MAVTAVLLNRSACCNRNIACAKYYEKRNISRICVGNATLWKFMEITPKYAQISLL